jgi:hypothetical protein
MLVPPGMGHNDVAFPLPFAGRAPAPGQAEAHDVVATLRDIGLPQVSYTCCW